MSSIKIQKAAAALSLEDRMRLIDDIRDGAQISGPLLANWVRDGLRVTRLVIAGNTDVIPIFWLRLYGILADIADHLAHQASVVADLAPGQPHLAPLFSLAKTIDELASVLTDDELIYLQYRRHTESHPLQDAYRLRLTPKGLKDEVTHRLLKVTKSQEETTDAITRILRRFRGEHLIAMDFARRLEVRLAAVQQASPAWLGPGTP
jgi:hypothetical protein